MSETDPPAQTPGEAQKEPPVEPKAKTLSRGEFIALSAMMFATVAFSIDAMLPALPEIGRELSPEAPNRAQLILTSFVLGMGLGTFVSGPLSDAFGRKPVIYGGAALYILGAGLATLTESLELVLAARVVQGLGSAGPRIVMIAIIRDLYSGRVMAQIMSFAMLIFTLVPAAAPLLGAAIISVSGWRGIFWAFVIFSALSTLWLGLRQPESLQKADRRAFRAAPLVAAVRECLSHPVVLVSILVQTLCFAMLFTMLTLVQPVYDVTFGRAESFPVWFGAVALVAGLGSLVNAALVVRVGMRRLIKIALASQVGLAGTMIAVGLWGGTADWAFYAFVGWQTTVFAMAGLTLGNLNAIAMEPMGHIAGTAASVMSGIATVASAMIAAPVGLAFDGTVLPLAIGVCAEAVLALWLMQWLDRVSERA